MSRQSLAAFARTVTVTWPDQDKEAARRFLIKKAREDNLEVIRDQASRAGVEPDVIAYANAPGQSLERVTLPGPIVHLYDYRREIVVVALAALKQASPVVSGLYRQSHQLFVNGGPVDQVPLRLEINDELMISNPVPYARRIEIGKTESGRDFVLQVPNRIYETVGKKLLRPRYRNVAKVSFTYVSIGGAYVTKGRLPARYGVGGGRFRKRQQKPGTAVNAPAIIIASL